MMIDCVIELFISIVGFVSVSLYIAMIIMWLNDQVDIYYSANMHPVGAKASVREISGYVSIYLQS